MVLADTLKQSSQGIRTGNDFCSSTASSGLCNEGRGVSAAAWYRSHSDMQGNPSKSCYIIFPFFLIMLSEQVEIWRGYVNSKDHSCYFHKGSCVCICWLPDFWLGWSFLSHEPFTSSHTTRMVLSAICPSQALVGGGGWRGSSLYFWINRKTALGWS